MADKVVAQGKNYRVFFGFGPNFDRILNAVKLIPGRRFVKGDGPGETYWSIPRTPNTIMLVANLAASYNLQYVTEDGEATDLQAEGAAVKADLAASFANSKAVSAEPFPIPGLSTQITPYAYQYAGARYAIECLKSGHGIFIADEIGLGKTGQAAMVIAAMHAYPCLYLTLASVKIGASREFEKWFPGLRILVLDGRKALPTGDYRDYDVIIANYDIIATVEEDPTRMTSRGKPMDKPKADTHLEELLQLPLRSLVLDECHKIKDYKTQTSRAAKLIGKVVGDGPKIALTGTPILNKAGELMSALNLLNLTDVLGGWWYVAERYCGYVEGRGMGAKKPPEKISLELHDLMRQHGYLRRLETDVKGDRPATLPGQIIPIDLTNRRDYNKALHQVEDYLAGVGMSSAKFDRAQALVQLSILRGLAAQGKIKPVIEWIENFLESTGKKFVIFADHIDVQNELAAAFPGCTYIRGADSALKRQLQIDRFTDNPDARLMVTSLKAGGTGVDGLQKVAHHVGFIELGWNPGIMDQAIGRLARRGQATSVQPYYFLARETIDDDMAALLDAKRKIVAAIIDGEDEASLKAREALLTGLEKGEDANLDIVKDLAQKIWAQSGRAEL